MFATFKLIGVTAAISAGVVTAYDLPQVRANGETRAKAYYDRVLPSEPAAGTKLVNLAVVQGPGDAMKADGKGDSLRTATPNCSTQAWPNISPDCLVTETGTPVRKAARTITIEKREGASTSVLMRVPSAEIASR